MKTIVMLALMCLGMTTCARPAKPGCKELFERNYEANIQAFMRICPGVDSVEARRRAVCMLDKLFEVDSTFVLKRGGELERLIRENLPALRTCDSVRQ